MLENETSHIRYSVSGLGCGACVNKLQKALAKIPGVAAATVHLDSATADIEVSAAVAAAELEAAADKLGYPMTALP